MLLESIGRIFWFRVLCFVGVFGRLLIWLFLIECFLVIFVLEGWLIVVVLYWVDRYLDFLRVIKGVVFRFVFLGGIRKESESDS